MYTFASIIPLIGGITLGAEKILGHPPEYIASWGKTFGGNDKYCLEYYDSTPYYELDTYKGALPHVDLVVALPPCAGLSMGNSSKTSRGCNAASNIHMLNASELAMTDILPRAMIVENAPNLFSKAGEEFAERINALANKHGYSMSLIKTSTIKHGLPQERTRSFFILWKGEKVPILQSVSKAYRPYHEFLGEASIITNSVSDRDTKPSEDPLWMFLRSKLNNLTAQEIICKFASERMVSVWEIIYKNGWLEEAAQTVTDPKVKRWLEHTLNKKSQGLNIMDATQKLAWERTQALMWKSLPFLRHPHKDRWLYTSEALKLMGFPDSFIKKVDIPTSQSNVICQNCPVGTSADWIQEIVEALDGNRPWVYAELKDEGSRKILRQNNLAKSNPMAPAWTL